jgi:hypothetical protein
MIFFHVRCRHHKKASKIRRLRIVETGPLLVVIATALKRIACHGEAK